MLRSNGASFKTCESERLHEVELLGFQADGSI